MLKTIGVLSILEENVLDEVLRLWNLFETKYGSTGVRSFAYPNLTFQAGRCHDVEPIENALSSLSGHLRPFELIIDGLGSFETHSKVIFLKVKLTEELRHINQLVNRMLQRQCEEVFDNYLPERWVPHVTVAMGDLTDANWEQGARDLSGFHPHYRQRISNIHLVQVCDETGIIEIVKSCTLGR
jgi:2'-5' RNA ligase